MTLKVSVKSNYETVKGPKNLGDGNSVSYVKNTKTGKIYHYQEARGSGDTTYGIHTEVDSIPENF